MPEEYFHHQQQHHQHQQAAAAAAAVQHLHNMLGSPLHLPPVTHICPTPTTHYLPAMRLMSSDTDSFPSQTFLPGECLSKISHRKCNNV